MHMLRDEDNAKYRMAIKNTLEFDPQILKRYVNFMNNPDEKTAVEQFGNGDKYFGVATLLSTLPGLPMFGHGQIEGLREKYGMEFRKPKLDETLDDGLIHGHEWKIFPLLHRRHLFADVENFLLYDFYRSDGRVDENVFAYSNRHGDELGLIIYHNRFADTRGWIKTSAAYLDKDSGDLRQKSLAEGLSLPFEGYVIFKDYVNHLEYIRSCAELWKKGLYVELNAYQCQAFMDFRFVDDSAWGMVNGALNSAGVESMQAKFDEMFGAKEVIEKKEISAEKAVEKKSAKRKTKKEAAKKPFKARKVAKATINQPKKTVRKTVVTAKKSSVSKPTTKKENKRAGKETVKASTKKIKKLGNKSERKKPSSKKTAKKK